jgi:hypothetical protein
MKRSDIFNSMNADRRRRSAKLLTPEEKKHIVEIDDDITKIYFKSGNFQECEEAGLIDNILDFEEDENV